MAGGSGLSPMVSIARAAAEGALLSSRRLHFLYGCRTEADLVDPAILSFLPEGSLTQALSEPGPGWEGEAGFLHEVVEAVLGPELPGFEVYFAGPAVMSAAVQKMAHEAGLPRAQLHFDEFY
jgi:toluene monooxygenase electron transfer component